MKGLERAWLSPTGQIIRIPDESHHTAVAESLLKERYNVTLEKIGPLTLLEQRGWIRVSDFMMKKLGKIIWIKPYNKKLTKKQEETVLEWCMLNNRNYDTCFIEM